MKSQFVTYEIALKLKELGFSEPCLAIYRDRLSDFGITLLSEGINIKGTQSSTLYYNSNKEMICLAPLWQQVIDWLDKTHGLFIHFNKSYTCYNYQIYKYDNIEDCNDIVIDEFLADLDYEEAREAAILKAIELCQKEK